jgi:PAT family beta-lactamase induction signal transducer AmpG
VFLSRLCSAAYTATQYALLSAIAAIARTFMAAPAGYLVEYVGWFDFFIISGLSAIPGLILIWILSRSSFATGIRAEEERNA